jgi:gamma-glutamyltranspeptidase/glutathione hydrolase
MVTYLNSLGGLHTLDDFAQAEGEYVTPIRTTYRGYDVYECPPNGQGIAALEMLNILSGFNLAELKPISAERLHLEIEAKRLAYRDRDALIGDPAQVDVPVERLLSPDYAAELRQSIRPDRAMTGLPPVDFPNHVDTIYLCVVDRDNNAVSFINSLFDSFGSTLVSPQTGVCLHSRGKSFRVTPGHPNCIAPGKRPLHTIIPGMLVKNDRAVMPFGVMGGHYQAMGHAHLLTNLIDFGLDIQEAIDLPRAFAEQTGEVEVESGVPIETVEVLRKLGYRPRPATKPLGGAQAIMIDWQQGVLTGGSEPRKDGCALGY